MRHGSFSVGVLLCSLFCGSALAAEHAARPAVRAPPTAARAPTTRAPSAQPAPRAVAPAPAVQPRAAAPMQPRAEPRARPISPPIYSGQPGRSGSSAAGRSWSGEAGRSWSGGHATYPSWHRHGHWWHGRRHGALGWWFLYDDVYPYSAFGPYTGFGFYPYVAPYVSAPPASPPPGAWYWCQSAEAYWPYVRRCPEGWQVVVPEPTGP